MRTEKKLPNLASKETGGAGTVNDACAREELHSIGVGLLNRDSAKSLITV